MKSPMKPLLAPVLKETTEYLMGRVWRKVTEEGICGKLSGSQAVCREVTRSLGKERCRSLKLQLSHSSLHVGEENHHSKHTYVLIWPLPIYLQQARHRNDENARRQKIG